MAKAVMMGAFQKNVNQKLQPQAKVTRQEAFCVIARVFKLTGGKTESLDKFKDKDQIAPWAVDALASMTEAGYINGIRGR